MSEYDIAPKTGDLKSTLIKDAILFNLIKLVDIEFSCSSREQITKFLPRALFEVLTFEAMGSSVTG